MRLNKTKLVGRSRLTFFVGANISNYSNTLQIFQQKITFFICEPSQTPILYPGSTYFMLSSYIKYYKNLLKLLYFTNRKRVFLICKDYFSYLCTNK